MKRIHLTTLVAVLSAGLVSHATAAPAPANWPQFRGPNSQGVAENAKPPVAFGPDEALLWKTPLPSGVSSPCIWGDRIFVTAFDVERKQLETICLDRKSGKSVWLVSGIPLSSCATPAVGEGTIFLTGTGAFGNRENVIQPPDFDELIAKYDTNQDGRIGTEEMPARLLFINRGTSSGAGSHSLSEILRQGPAGKHKSYDRAEWAKASAELLTDFNTGYFMKTAAFAVRTGGQGDATNHIVWMEPKGVPEVPSPLLYRGRLYYIKNGGLFTCRDPKTGKSLYDERVGAEGGYYASPVAADGRIYVASDRGVITVLKAGDTFTVLCRTELKEPIMATPAIVEDKIYVRTAGHLWAFGEK